MQALDIKNHENIEILLRRIHNDLFPIRPQEKPEIEPIDVKQCVIIGLAMTTLFIIAKLLSEVR